MKKLILSLLILLGSINISYSNVPQDLSDFVNGFGPNAELHHNGNNYVLSTSGFIFQLGQSQNGTWTLGAILGTLPANSTIIDHNVIQNNNNNNTPPPPPGNGDTYDINFINGQFTINDGDTGNNVELSDGTQIPYEITNGKLIIEGDDKGDINTDFLNPQQITVGNETFLIMFSNQTLTLNPVNPNYNVTLPDNTTITLTGNNDGTITYDGVNYEVRNQIINIDGVSYDITVNGYDINVGVHFQHTNYNITLPDNSTIILSDNEDGTITYEGVNYVIENQTVIIDGVSYDITVNGYDITVIETVIEQPVKENKIPPYIKKKSKGDKIVDAITDTYKDFNSIGDIDRFIGKYGNVYVQIPVSDYIDIQYKNERGEEYIGIKISIPF